MTHPKGEEHEQHEPSRQCVCLVRHGCYPEDVRDRKEARALVEAGYAVDVVCLKKPLVISRLPPIERQFGPSCVMFFEPDDHPDLARRIWDVFHDPEAARQRALQAYECYRALSWEHSKRIYRDTVSSLIGPSLTRPPGPRNLNLANEENTVMSDA